MLLARELGIGGSERQLVEVAKALDRARFQVHVGYFREGFRVEELRRAGIPVFEIPVRSLRSSDAVSGARVLRRYLREHAIQLVHAFDYPLICFGVPVAKLAGVPAVLSSQRSSRKLVPRAYRHLLRVTDRFVNGIVVNCEAIRCHLIEDEGVSAERIRLCYNGVDTETFSEDNRRIGAPLAIGTICALRPEKGVDLLLESFAKMKSGEAMKLVVVGSGPARAGLETLSGEIGIRERVHFEPETNQVASWVRSMDIFVLPSRSEALSNALMEAMASGCACIASNVGGNPELIRHEETGLLFESGDSAELARAMEWLSEDEEMRTRLARAGAKRMREEFSISTAASRMAEIYESFLA